MKKLTVCFLILILSLSLAGCESDLNEPANFYYPRKSDTIHFGTSDGLITMEPREVAGHSGDLRYILSLYLLGPLDSDLDSPFPDGTTLEDIDVAAGILTITLSDSFSQLSGMDLTIACACLSSTCFELIDVAQVTILSPKTELHSQVEITLDRNSLTLLDTLPLTTE